MHNFLKCCRDKPSSVKVFLVFDRTDDAGNLTDYIVSAIRSFAPPVEVDGYITHLIGGTLVWLGNEMDSVLIPVNVSDWTTALPTTTTIQPTTSDWSLLGGEYVFDICIYAPQIFLYLGFKWQQSFLIYSTEEDTNTAIVWKVLSYSQILFLHSHLWSFWNFIQFSCLKVVSVGDLLTLYNAFLSSNHLQCLLIVISYTMYSYCKIIYSAFLK